MSIQTPSGERPETTSKNTPKSAATTAEHSTEKNVLRLGWVSLLNDIGSETISRLVPFYVSGVLGAGMAVVGTIEGVSEATSTLLKPLFGSLSDKKSVRFSKKKFVLAGYFLSSVTRPLLALAVNPFSVGLLRAADRFGKAIRVAPRDALIANSKMASSGNGPETAVRQGKKFGINRAMDTAGAVLGVALFALFLKYHSLELTTYEWKILCIASVIPAVFALVIIAYGITEPAVAAQSTPDRVAPETAVSPILKRYLVAVGVFGLANSSDAFILLKTRQLGYSLLQTLGMVVLLNLFSSATAIPAAILSDRFGRRTLIVGGWTIYAASYAAIGFNVGADRPWLFALILAFYGLFYGFTEGVEKAWVADLTTAESRGRAYGFFGLVVGLSALPANAIFGWAWDRFGDQVPFLASSALALFSVAILFALVPSRQIIRYEGR